MRNLLSSVFNRQLALLETLNQYKNGIPVDALTEILGCSERLLREDITDLNKNTNCLTVQSERRHVYIEYPNNKNIDTVVQYMYSNTSAFQIIELIFNDENLSSKELAEMCGVSPPTIYRTVNNINTELEKYYGLTIEKNPYRISGDEREIRDFYTYYFKEKYLAYPWPFASLDEFKFEAFLRNMLRKPAAHFNFAEFRFIKIAAAVSYIRYMSGNFADFENMQLNDYFIDRINDMAFEVKEQHESFLGTKIDINFVRQLFHRYVVKGYYISYDDFIEGAADKTKSKQSISMIEDLIHNLSSEFNLTIPNNEDVMLQFHNTCVLAQRPNFRSYIIRDQTKGLRRTVRQLNPEFYTRMIEEIENYMFVVRESQNQDAVNYAAFTLIATWNHLFGQLQHYKKPVSVLLFSIVGNFRAEMIKEILTYEFNDKLSIEIYNGYNFRKEEIEKLGYDICITDFSVEQPGKQRYLSLNDIPSPDDLLVIKEMIKDIYGEK